MKSFRIFDRQAGRIITAFGLLVATVIPAFTPALAAAAQITGRSIELSSSSKSATGVTYNVVFTPVASAGATAVQFCSDTPLIGESCADPGGTFSVASAAVSSATSVSKPTVAASKGPVVVIEQAVTGGSETTLTITGITNPSTAGSLYARIITYDTKAHAENDYTATGAGGDNDGIGGAGSAASNAIDTGSVALSITDEIGVDAKVLESLVFCVSKGLSGSNTTNLVVNDSDGTEPGLIGDACSGTLTNPSMQLGHDVGGGVIALADGQIDYAKVHTQISTNATSGAVVRLKTDSPCGGLRLAGSTWSTGADDDAACPIKAATTGSISLHDSKFGLRVSDSYSTAGATSATGSFKRAGSYDKDTYSLGFVSGNASGVGSTYGDPILQTVVGSAGAGADGPANNANSDLTFGATINSGTPAGKYSAKVSLVATGKF